MPLRSGLLRGTAVFLLIVSPLAAQEPLPRPRLALALGGGGARGIAHIGALRAFEEAGLPVDAIVGTSMGAVVGSIYATGLTTAELEAIVRSLDWQSLFSGRPDRRNLPVARRQDRLGALAGLDFDRNGAHLPGGLLADHRVNRFLIEHLAAGGYAAGGDFDRLPIRFRAVATALDDGDRVVLARGDLARAVRASMSIPLIFPPVDWGGRPLVDGGVVNNLPVGVARELGAAVVVAVEVGSPPLEPAEYRSALGVASRVNDILGRRRNADFAQPADVHLRPELGRHSFRDYSSFDRLIQLGYQAAQQGVPEIRRRLAASGAAEAAAEQAPRDGPRLEGTPIAQVAVRGNERLSERLVRRTFNIPLGRPFELKRGLRAFDKVPATGLVDQAWMEFEPAPQGLRIGLRIQEAAPNRAEVGGAYTEWEKARGVLRLRNRNTLGFGEETELLLAGSSAESLFSLTLRGDRLFLAGLGYRLGAFAGEDRPRFFDDSGDVINRAQFERRGIDVTLRAGLERWGLVEAGLRVGRVKTVPTAGIDVVAGSDQVRSLVAAVTVDDLDDLLWPRTGERLVLTGEWSLQELGATRESWRAAADARAARGLGGRVILQLDARLGASGGDLPVYDHFRLGGPYLVPGYRHEELLGPQALAGALSLHCRAVGALRAFVRAGAGNAFETTDEVGLDALRWGAGLGLMHPTPLGPVSLELGVNEGGRALVTLSLGWN